MSPLDSNQHRAAKQGADPVAEIEKGGLLLGNVEFQIEEHLLTHGTRIAPETRWFLAQVRDALGTAFQESLEKARSDVSAGVKDAKDADEAAGLLVNEDPDADMPVGGAAGDEAESGSPRRLPASRLSMLKSVTQTGLSAACGALLTLLLLHEGSPSGTEDQPLVLAGATSPASRPVQREQSLARSDAGQESPSRSAVQAAEHEPLETLMAQMSRTDGDGYPGSRERREHTFPTEPVAPMRPAATEDMLDLPARARAEVQRRLALAGFDPGAVDGIFGPATRAALRAWQAASGLTGTGYLDEVAWAALVEHTENEYLAWQAAKQTRASERVTRTAAVESPLPPRSPQSAMRCERAPSGDVRYGQGVKCDFRGLKEDIARLFGGKRRAHEVAQGERGRTSDGA